MKQQPLFASEQTAARLLDMKRSDFARLVEEGSLPRATKFERWDVEQLQKSMRGDMIEGLENTVW
jgi:hypothetical protein